MTTTLKTAVPVAPGNLPLLGHTLSLLRSPVALLQSLREQGDIVVVNLGRRPVYVINSPDLIHHILVTDSRSYAKGRYFYKARPFVGNGLATSEGDLHMRQRRLMLPGFHRERLRVYADIMRDQTTKMTDRWKTGQQIDADKAMNELTLTVTTKALFRSDLGDTAVDAIQRWLPVFLKEAMLRAMSPVDALERLPTRGNRRFEHARRGLKNVTNDLIADYLKDPVDHGDLMSMLVSARDEATGEPMDHQQLHDELMTLLIAGTESTATALSWLFYELGKRPDIRARLIRELRDELGDRDVTFDDLPELVYTRALASETLRRHSPIWVTMRRTINSVELAGLHIPAQSELLYSPATIHRDSAFYDDPDRFDPSRWLDASPPKKAFLPFGGGKHRCIGDHFALTEMVMVVATLCRRWDLALLPGTRSENCPPLPCAPIASP